QEGQAEAEEGEGQKESQGKESPQQGHQKRQEGQDRPEQSQSQGESNQDSGHHHLRLTSPRDSAVPSEARRDWTGFGPSAVPSEARRDSTGPRPSAVPPSEARRDEPGQGSGAKRQIRQPSAVPHHKGGAPGPSGASLPRSERSCGRERTFVGDQHRKRPTTVGGASGGPGAPPAAPSTNGKT